MQTEANNGRMEMENMSIIHLNKQWHKTVSKLSKGRNENRTYNNLEKIGIIQNNN